MTHTRHGQRESSDLTQALNAFREGAVVVLAPDPRRPGGGCLLVALETLQGDALSFIRQHTHGLISVLLRDRQQQGIHLFLSNAGDTDEALAPALVAALPVLLRALAQDPACARHLASDVGAPFISLSSAGSLSWPDSERVVSALASRLDMVDAALICSLSDNEGRCLQGDEVSAFAIRHGLALLHPGELAGDKPALPATRVQRLASSRLPTRHGEFRLHAFSSGVEGVEHAVLVWGEVDGHDEVLVRLHSECLTGDVLGSLRCDCGPQLDMSLSRIAAAPRGVLIYLRGHEGRGIGFGHKVRAYALQDDGLDTVDANVALGLPVGARRFDCAADILLALGVRSVSLLSNNPRKKDELARAGMPVVRVLPVVPPSNGENVGYLTTKKKRMGHDLPFD